MSRYIRIESWQAQQSYPIILEVLMTVRLPDIWFLLVSPSLPSTSWQVAFSGEQLVIGLSRRFLFPWIWFRRSLELARVPKSNRSRRLDNWSRCFGDRGVAKFFFVRFRLRFRPLRARFFLVSSLLLLLVPGSDWRLSWSMYQSGN